MGSRGRARAELWDRCRRRLDELDLPDPFEVEAFIEALAQDRGRPIGLLPVPTQPDLLCGLVVATQRADWIIYRTDTTALHRQHILLHEAAHIVCGHGEHTGDGGAMASAVRALMPHLSSELVRSVLGRTLYTEPAEREAELLASLILDRVKRRERRAAAAEVDRSSLDALFGLSNT